MKLVKIIISTIAAAALLFALCIPSAAATAGNKYVCDLDIGKTVDGPFSIGAIRMSDGEICAVDPTAVDDTHKIAGTDVVAAIKGNTDAIPESVAEDLKFYIVPVADGTYASAIVFTAPEDGTYTANALVAKGRQGWIAVYLEANDVVVAERPLGDNGYFTRAACDLFAENVELKKGEQLLLVVAARTENLTNNSKFPGDLSVGIVSFEVTRNVADTSTNVGTDTGANVGTETGSSSGGSNTSNKFVPTIVVITVVVLALAVTGVVIVSKKKK